MKPRQLPLPETFTLQCADRSISYHIIRSPKRRRTIGIRVDSERGVEIAAPLYARHDEIELIIRRRAKWILGLLERPVPPRRQFVSGETVPLLGENVRLEICAVPRAASETVRLNDGVLQIAIISEGAANAERMNSVLRALETWLRDRAGTVLSERVGFFAKRLGVHPSNMRLGNQKSRWGSCTRNGVLRFNWRIIMAPMDVLDYLVVHELCHLLHLNHGKRFWARVAGLLPNYMALRRQLLREGAGYRLI